MLTRSIKKNTDFRSVLNKSHKFVSKSMVVFSDYNQLDEPRIGLIVSKKNGIAVTRNKIKRRLRAAFKIARENNQFKIADIVIVARKPALETNFVELVKEIENCLKKIDII